MKIIADENMPYVDALFGYLGKIEYVNGRTLTPKQVEDADVLLVRSVTKVNAALINNAHKLKFVGSATIGTDHVDVEYLSTRNIYFTNAPGCNATAVGEYAFIAMLELAQRFGESLAGKVVGIVGAGNTGTAAAKCMQAYGLKVLLCDPIKALQGDTREFVSLDTIIEQADIISLHVPITKEGEHKTWYLFDEARLNKLKPNTWLLNCCRGEVIDNRALIKFKLQRDDVKLVLDVWEGEPNPMAELVALAEFATPHIAGYSLEGKARGTFMLYQKWCELLDFPVKKSLESLLPAFQFNQIVSQGDLTEGQLLKLSRLVYDLRDDDFNFRGCFSTATGFDLMRKNHTYRREYSAISLTQSVDYLSAGSINPSMLNALGFN
ncbi:MULTISPECIES: 4-phosphoerythronate dehydrogenase [Shewanella]|uniref:4-phosphoerythronate dehydrogenase n=1 Tax=Shewanella TaxID=22 RepID=UPI000C3B2FD5|nr:MULTISPECIES: 4-phosphoerythronate dehydrogenase [Shewanella]NCQ44909.1 4-phosphoerythronate dehydrogenase [Shewanella frigidimarina]NCO73508.1 4-phosphoerythronate dehydrogenase [Shewanella vesiculosa]NCP37549.1 4-phosphoerythronate dehydrogenase [Shewanella vesiculosa]NCP71631.1 4-phosphoerythronate dehydrogenase [Shewanella vesiculosa]NCP74785.1 4-phosphoerythronate dehydrogenase [Shewanella vesiculosa]